MITDNIMLPSHTTHSSKRNLIKRLFGFIQLTLLATAITACQSAPGIHHSASKEERLTEFQWALSTGAMFFFVQYQGTLVPAQAVDHQVLESIPVKKRIQLMGLEKELIIALHSILSPYDIQPEEWQLQLEQSTGWVTAKTFRFTDAGFVTDIRPAPISVGEFASIRFIPH